MAAVRHGRASIALTAELLDLRAQPRKRERERPVLPRRCAHVLCGKLLPPPPPGAGRPRLFCNNTCCARHHRQERMSALIRG